MRTREQAFKAYYGAMADSELLTVAKNRESLISLAQAVLAQELQRRRIVLPAAAPDRTRGTSNFLTRLWHIVRGDSKHPFPANQEPNGPRPRIMGDHIARDHSGPRRTRRSLGHIGATEDMVNMVGTLPERVNRRGAKVEDIAGTGEHDSLGG